MKISKALFYIGLCSVLLFTSTTFAANDSQGDSAGFVTENNPQNNLNESEPVWGNSTSVNNMPVNSNITSDFPYIGVITSESVYVRSGPATPYYPVGKLTKGQEVIVTQIRPGKRSWARVEPVPGSFAYISCEFVKILDTIDSNNMELTDSDENIDESTPNETDEEADVTDDNEQVGLLGKELLTGIVTGDNVRIRAGSIDISPTNANRVLMLAKKGQEVKVIGKRDEFYKIVPPRGSYFWVAADYIKRSDKTSLDYVNEVRNQNSELIANVTSSDELKSQYVQLRDVLNEYEAVQKMPLMDRDYATLRLHVEKLGKETDSETVKSTAEMLLKTILKGETAQKQLLASIAQDKQIEEAMLKIDQAVDKALRENTPADDSPDIIVVKGKLAKSAVFTTGVTKRYLLLDNAGLISYYVSGDDLEKYVGRQISVSGPSSFDPSTQTKFIEASRVIVIEE